MPAKPYRTPRRKEIMGLVLREFEAGHDTELRTIFGLLSDPPSYDTYRNCIFLMVKDELLDRMKAGYKVYLVPTQKARDWFRVAK